MSELIVSTKVGKPYVSLYGKTTTYPSAFTVKEGFNPVDREVKKKNLYTSVAKIRRQKAVTRFRAINRVIDSFKMNKNLCDTLAKPYAE